MRDAKGVRLAVRLEHLTPNGGRDGIDGFETDAAGERYLKARVRAVPEDGKANKALIELIARRFGVAKSCVRLVSGETSRKKSSGSMASRRIWVKSSKRYDYFLAALARSIDSRISSLALAEPSQPNSLTHLPGSRSL
jgi:uncharacterized protein YggU (UPF0235/DUF167 family)